MIIKRVFIFEIIMDYIQKLKIFEEIVYLCNILYLLKVGIILKRFSITYITSYITSYTINDLLNNMIWDTNIS